MQNEVVQAREAMREEARADERQGHSVYSLRGGANFKLEVFWVSKEKGWGVRALEDIPENQVPASDQPKRRSVEGGKWVAGVGRWAETAGRFFAALGGGRVAAGG